MNVMNHTFNSQRLLLSCSFSLVSKIRLTTPISNSLITKHSNDYYKNQRFLLHLKNKIRHVLQNHCDDDTEHINITTSHQYYDVDYFIGVRIINLYRGLYEDYKEWYISVTNGELSFKLSIIGQRYSTVLNMTTSINSINVQNVDMVTNFNPLDANCLEESRYFLEFRFMEQIQDNVIFVGTKFIRERFSSVAISRVYFVLIYNQRSGFRYKILESITSDSSLNSVQCIIHPKEQTLLCIYSSFKISPLGTNDQPPYTDIYGCNDITGKLVKSTGSFKINIEGSRVSYTSIAYLGDHLVHVSHYNDDYSQEKLVIITWINPNTWFVEDTITFRLDLSIVDIKLVEISSYASCLVIVKQNKQQQRQHIADIYYL